MFFLGIDIGKNTHVASLIDDNKNVIFKALSFSNTVIGAQSILEKLTHVAESLEIGMEATGHYWLSLYSFLVEKGFCVHVRSRSFTLLIQYRPMDGDVESK